MQHVEKGIQKFKKIVEDIDGSTEHHLWKDVETFFRRTGSVIDNVFSSSTLTSKKNILRQLHYQASYAVDNNVVLKNLEQYIGELIDELETFHLPEKPKSLIRAVSEIEPPIPKLPHVWSDEEFNFVIDAILPRMEYKVDISITDLLSGQLYNYVEFLSKDRRGKVNAQEVIEYMMEAGLISKNNKDTEELTKFGNDIKRKGGWLKHLQVKLNEIERMVSPVQAGPATYTTHLPPIVIHNHNNPNISVPITNTINNPVAPVTPHSIEKEKKESFFKGFGQRFTIAVIIKLLIWFGGFGSAALVAFKWDAIANYFK
jgi:hypothetical protein